MSDEIWNFERVQRMIEDGVEESIHLDYKGAGSLAKISQKRDEIIKDVTAFANSDGGVIIYGVAEYGDAARKHLPESIDPINRSEFSKEWLEQVISNASPRIRELRIHPIPIPGDETRCLYVAEIPKGETAYQAPDCKYYRRYNFESVPMRDHEVRDVMNRIKVPRLEVEAFLGIRNLPDESRLLFKLRNVGSRMAVRFACRVRIPPKLDGIGTTPKAESLLFDEDTKGDYYEVTLGQNPHQLPLFPKSSIIFRQQLNCHVRLFERFDGRLVNPRPTIGVVVYADEMEPLRLEFDAKAIREAWGPPL